MKAEMKEMGYYRRNAFFRVLGILRGETFLRGPGDRASTG
jgi:hypothetical protein